MAIGIAIVVLIEAVSLFIALRVVKMMDSQTGRIVDGKEKAT